MVKSHKQGVLWLWLYLFVLLGSASTTKNPPKLNFYIILTLKFAFCNTFYHKIFYYTYFFIKKPCNFCYTVYLYTVCFSPLTIISLFSASTFFANAFLNALNLENLSIIKLNSCILLSCPNSNL